MEFLKHATRNLFFTGKGGVGKTSVACAAAVTLADEGKRVLLVSTDPASNLDEVLGTTLQHHPTLIPGIPNLSAMNLDPEQSAADYREKMVGPYRTLLPPAAIASMEEQFSGSCTLEIAAFDEFSRLLGNADATSQFEHVIFDTAPTGHTLRLLTLPSAWSGFMENNTTGTSCLGPLAGLHAQQVLYQDTVKALSNPAVTTLILVTRAEGTAFREAARTSGELHSLGVANQYLVINAVFEATDATDPFAVAMQRRGEKAIAEMPDLLKGLPHTSIPLTAGGILGVDALRNLGKSQKYVSAALSSLKLGQVIPRDQLPKPLSAMIKELADPGHGVILAMGKGGVGKTTVAAAVAVALAEFGHNVHLSTTDPAAHIAAAVAGEAYSNLTVSRIDPVAETARYSQEAMNNAGAGLDASGRALLEEDLRSPCTEEIAVFRAFADAVAEGTDRFVVLDTAPTGHTVLLLDSALAYHREVTRQTSGMPEAVENLLPRLRDRQFTRVLIVTLPEATPVHEAAQLQRDLRRAEIEPYGWVINNSLSPLTISDPLLAERQKHEARYIQEVVNEHATRTALIAWQLEPPVGPEALKRAIQPESAAGKEKETPGSLFREVETYVVNRITEFQQIPLDRKRELEQLADYIRTCIKQGKPANLTFVCTHNSRRSHLTQVWAQIAATYYRLSGVRTFSGGTEATACNSRTVDALKRCGIRFSTSQDSNTNPRYSVAFSDCAPSLLCYSKIFNQSPNPSSDYCAVMTCSHADQNCPVAIGCDLRLAIRYEDPKVADDTPVESATYDERCAQIAREMLYAMYEVEH